MKIKILKEMSAHNVLMYVMKASNFNISRNTHIIESIVEKVGDKVFTSVIIKPKTERYYGP